MVYEEKYVKHYGVHPLQAVGCEGSLNFALAYFKQYSMTVGQINVEETCCRYVSCIFRYYFTYNFIVRPKIRNNYL